jgi:hypothetical protein
LGYPEADATVVVMTVKPSLKVVSACTLWLQIVSLALLAVVVLRGCAEVARQGAGFVVASFESTMSLRLAASLAPGVALAISVALTIRLRRKAAFGRAIWLPLLFVAVVSGAGQLHLAAVPDPIQENFGSRPVPYPGFLFLPSDQVPSGFTETKHHYTKVEYMIYFTTELHGQRIYLNIVEGSSVTFGVDKSALLQEFTYLRIPGRIYRYVNGRTHEATLSLIWLNPPRQRISIWLTQTPANDYSPEDLIRILKNMRAA